VVCEVSHGARLANLHKGASQTFKRELHKPLTNSILLRPSQGSRNYLANVSTAQGLSARQAAASRCLYVHLDGSSMTLDHLSTYCCYQLLTVKSVVFFCLLASTQPMVSQLLRSWQLSSQLVVCIASWSFMMVLEVASTLVLEVNYYLTLVLEATSRSFLPL